ncbi:hypothetical protein CANARDRAFT_7148 [[Candida] arabinofermentans NRRL YB-2248]|uniref:Uncharacterized protein n=1 Tax=[Candida] arabinofermentans NRRL YB-2248 TaxID=983967 RepID=A0A1E4T262_9ASCO|nr:hypothetical protein CANARDRAFT_7148 [[Candida] arabinofermentans NRRL YB-2248]
MIEISSLKAFTASIFFLSVVLPSVSGASHEPTLDELKAKYNHDFNLNNIEILQHPYLEDLPVFTNKHKLSKRDDTTSGCSTAVTVERPSSYETSQKAYQFLDYFWSQAMYPTDIVQADSINSTLFTNNSRGRVSVTRNFDGVELNTEYIFGLFARVPDVEFSMLGYPTSYIITEFAGGNGDGFFASSTILNFTFPQLEGFVIPSQADFWIKLKTEDGLVKIDEYDAVFRNFPWTYNVVAEVSGAALVQAAVNTTYASYTGEELIKMNAAKSICDAAMQYCVGDDSQYNSFEECFEYLYEDVRIGQGYEGGQDTVFCRNVHQPMLAFRPHVHCSHVGPTGGDMCRDSDMAYDDVVWRYVDYFDNMVYYSSY